MHNSVSFPGTGAAVKTTHLIRLLHAGRRGDNANGAGVEPLDANTEWRKASYYGNGCICAANRANVVTVQSCGQWRVHHGGAGTAYTRPVQTTWV